MHGPADQPYTLSSPGQRRLQLRRALGVCAGFLLALAAFVIPGGWTFSELWQAGPIQGKGVWLESAVLRPIRVNGSEGTLLWLHTDPAFSRKLRASINIPDLPPGSVQSGFVAIQGHGEVFRGEHYVLLEGVRQWIPTAQFVAKVREWIGYDAQILLLACNPDGARVDIPNTIYWKDNLVDVTYGIGPWVFGKYIEDDPDNGPQRPILTDTQAPEITLTPIQEAIARLHAAIGAQTLPIEAETDS